MLNPMNNRGSQDDSRRVLMLQLLHTVRTNALGADLRISMHFLEENIEVFNIQVALCTPISDHEECLEEGARQKMSAYADDGLLALASRCSRQNLNQPVDRVDHLVYKGLPCKVS